jgi:ketosteroid isomerase-like protein
MSRSHPSAPWLLGLIPWVTFGCEPGAGVEDLTVEDRDAIQAIGDRYAEYVLTGDPVGIVGLYHPEGAAIPPDHPPVRGHGELRDWLAATEGVVSWPEFTLDLVEIGGTRALAWAWQGYRYTTEVVIEGETVDWEDAGDWILLLRRDGQDSWLIYRDIWNRSHPPTGP